MKFYFCDKYIYIDGDENKVERDMYVLSHIFRILIIILGIRSKKVILKLSSVILF